MIKEKSLDNDQGYTNELIHEASPYLLQHAHNPVNWHAWNEKTLAKARKGNKPLLVSIGYSACHWCHVMERESFSDEGVADLMNREFISIKIDREERPDLDHFYMSAVQSIHGQGGWPLNCFAFPDGKPFWGGTYFSKEQWMKILQQMAGLFKNHPDTLEKEAGKILVSIGKNLTQETESDFSPLTPDDLTLMENNIMRFSDPANGGLGFQPKFPMPLVYRLLLMTGVYIHQNKLPEQVILSLTNMAKGGIFDHVGGGFARYSTDAEWHIPHFEKMLYDNAQLVELYTEAFRLGEDPLFRDTAIRTLDFINEELGSGKGGFFTALDADSDDEEGVYYIWSEREIKHILGGNAAQFADFFGINSFSLWENDLNVLRKRNTENEYAGRKGIDPEIFSKEINSDLEKLKSQRSKRNRPLRDEKIITSVNALVINAFIKAYRVYGRQEYLNTAIKTGEFIRNYLFYDDGRLYHTYSGGKPRIQGLLEDYACAVGAFLNLFETTGDENWFFMAEKLCNTAVNEFYDPEKKVFWLSSIKSRDVVIKTTDLFDNVVPSPVSVMAHNLFILGHFCTNPEYLAMSRSLCAGIRARFLEYPVSYANWGMLMLKMSFPYHVVCITGKDAVHMHHELMKLQRPDLFIVAAARAPGLEIFRGRFAEDGSNRIYICGEGYCLEPVKTVEEVIRLINHG